MLNYFTRTIFIIVILSGGYLLLMQPQLTAPPVTDVPLSAPPGTFGAGRSGEFPDTARAASPAVDEVGALKNELADLKSEVTALKQRLKSAESALLSSSHQENSQNSAQLFSPEEMRVAEKDVARATEEGRDLLKRRVESVDASFLAEPRDPLWANQAAALIHSVWGKLQPEGASLVEVECHASMCRMEIDVSGAADLEADLFPELASMLPEVLSGDSASEGDSAGTRRVYYLKRDPFFLAGDGAT